MSVKEVVYCDLCEADGQERKAIAQYWGDTGELWFACAKHLKLVEEGGLEYEKLAREEE